MYGVIGASVLLQFFGLLLPFISKFLIDDVMPTGVATFLPALGVGIVLIILSRSLLIYLRGLLLVHLQVNFDTTTTSKVYAHLLSLPYHFFQVRSSGDLISRLSSVTQLRNLLTSQLASTIIDGTLVIVYLAILIWSFPVLAYTTLALGFSQLLLVYATSGKMRELLRETLFTAASLQSYQVETLKGIATLKAAGSEERAYSRWKSLFNENLNSGLKKDRFVTVIVALRSFLELLSPLLLLWLGTYMVINDQLSLGAMIAINAIAISFLTPLTSLANTIIRIQEGSVHLDRVSKILITPSEPRIEQQNDFHLDGNINLKDVWFKYGENESYILNGINVSITRGQKIAIVGRTGAGKSTLGLLLVGLFQCGKGTILFDKRPIETLDLLSLRRQIGVVLQEPFLFSGSIRQNIAFNTPELNLQAIRKAAQMACIDQEIEQMPLGYDTLIAEGGTSLSGGQVQRIAMARALASNPSVLLLDEATSHLDANTEHQIDRVLNGLSCTRIFIAHRLSTIINADQILYIEKGKIEAHGTHEELLDTCQAYVELFDKQHKTQNIIYS